MPHYLSQDTKKALKRIFWLGKDKLLVITELVRLRKLGFEVFNPLDWDSKQPTTLPKHVFECLSECDFFHNTIPEKIGELLNTYFDVVIVTQSPDWLASILSVYKGKIIYRTYGQKHLLSDDIKRKNLLIKISCHQGFIFMPHAKEDLKGEHIWLKNMAQTTPYCVSDDIVPFANTWKKNRKKRSEIMITCPVIKNRIYNRYCKFSKKGFNEKHYHYYGAQLSKIKDPSVARDALLHLFQSAAGYLYTYSDPRVCYLPPIEMMIVGGPVLFLKGSLLDQFFDKDAPGRCHSIEEAKEKVQRLLNNDQPFIEEVIASQDTVKGRYMPDYVWPIFDRNIVASLMDKTPSSCLITDDATNSSAPKDRIYLLHHFPQPLVFFDGETYTAYDGIVRVMRTITQILSTYSDSEIVITAWHADAELLNGYFNDFTKESRSRVRVLVIDPYKSTQKITYWIPKIKNFLKRYAPDFLLPALNLAQTVIYRIDELLMLCCNQLKKGDFSSKFDYLHKINGDKNCKKVIVPHYYFFPEAVSLEKDIYINLPDYMPHFFHDTGEFKAIEGRETTIGRAIAKKAKVVFCYSHFTKNYLPDSKLKVDEDKIRVFFLPHLNNVSKIKDTQIVLPDDLTQYRYIFYPTQARPNKNLSLLLKIFDELVARGHRLKLVLTTSLNNQKAYKTYRSLASKKEILFKEKASNDLMEVLYRNAALLCFTSLAEGNFPPQIQEALSYDTPIVASNLGFITERIPPHLEGGLKLCEPGNVIDFINACEEVLNDRERVIQKQRPLNAYIKKDTESFRRNILELFTAL